MVKRNFVVGAWRRGPGGTRAAVGLLKDSVMDRPRDRLPNPPSRVRPPIAAPTARRRPEAIALT
jgi:hypothetical protein